MTCYKTIEFSAVCVCSFSIANSDTISPISPLIFEKRKVRNDSLNFSFHVMYLGEMKMINGLGLNVANAIPLR